MRTTGRRMGHIALQAAACGAMMLVSTACATQVFPREYLNSNVRPVVARVDGSLSQTDRHVKQPRVTQVAAQAVEGHPVADKRIPDTDAASARPEKASAENQNRSPVESLRVRFANGKSDLGQKQKRKLDAMAEKLTANPTYTAEIDGEAHRQGAKSYNDTLSWRRREAVHRYLIEKRSDLLPRVSLISAKQDVTDPPDLQTGRRDVTITIYKPVLK